MNRSDLELIFSEILLKFKADVPNVELRTVNGFNFVFFHNRLQGYEYSKDYKACCERIWSDLDSTFRNGQKIDRVAFFPQSFANLVTKTLSPENLGLFEKLLSPVVTREIEGILTWRQNINRKYRVSLLINSDFKMNGPIDNWSRVEWDKRDLALAAYRSGIGYESFIRNHIDAFWFVKEFDGLLARDELIEHFSILRLSLSLAVKERLLIHDVTITPCDWEGCPYIPHYFSKMRGHIEESWMDGSAIRFFLTSFNINGGGPTFSHERVLDNNLYSKWNGVVTNRIHRSAFHHILNGLSDVLKSHNYGSYNEQFVTSDGLTKIFIGLDGMIADKSNRRANTKNFVNYWHPIFLKVDSDISKNKIKKIYSLRSALLHGDYEHFLKLYPDVYKIICPKDVSRDISVQHFAFNFAAFLFRTILKIESEINLLKGPTTKISFWRKLLTKIGFHVIF